MRFGPQKNDEPKQPAMSGYEMMLRSMGLGELMDAAKAIAASGAANRIIEFSNALPQIQQDLSLIKGKLGIVSTANGAGTEPSACDEAGPNASIEEQQGSSDEHTADRQPGRTRKSNRPLDA